MSSPLSRGVDTAKLAAFSTPNPIQTSSNEDYGDDEGLTTAQIRERRNADWLLWRDGAAGGEVNLYAPAM